MNNIWRVGEDAFFPHPVAARWWASQVGGEVVKVTAPDRATVVAVTENFRAYLRANPAVAANYHAYREQVTATW